MVKELADCYGRNSDKFKDIWAARLLEADFTLEELRDALDHCVESVSSFPSFADFKGLASSKRSYFLQDNQTDIEHQRKLKEEREKASQAKADMIKAIGEERAIKYVSWWYKKTFGSDAMMEMESFGMSIGIYQHSAFLDLYEAGYDISKVEKVIEKKRASMP